jgi:hypothetical protein
MRTSSIVIQDAILRFTPLRRGVKLGWGACCGPASIHHLAVKAELASEATMEEVKGMQRDLVVYR